MITWFRNQHLVFRLLLLTCGVSLMIVLFNTLLFEWFYLQQQQKSDQQQLAHKVRALTPAITEHLSSNDIPQLEKQLQLLFALSEANSMRVLSNDKTLFLFGDFRPEAADRERVDSYNIVSEGGALSLTFTSKKTHPRAGIEPITIAKIVASVIQTLALCGCIFYFWRSLIFRHLRKISDFAEHLSVRNLSQQLKLDRSPSQTRCDELDTLASSIETMRVQLIEDFDNRKSMELALLREKEENIEARKLIEDTKAADRAKSQFIATMSHEIRTPMNGIMGMVQMLQSTGINDEQKNYLNIISQSSNALMHIINDILDFSKIESGDVPLEPESISLAEHIKQSVQLFIGIANSKNIDLIANIHPDVPDAIYADAKRLTQVLSNLLGNAFKFTESGRITLTIETKSVGAKTTTLEFNVTDTGIGISEENQESIFQAYTQADSSMTRKFGGTGLGLAICKKIIHLMGGDIGVKSEAFVGSRFWFTAKFPIEHQNEPREKAPKDSDRAVIYIDNELDNATQLAEHAKNMGVEFKSFREVDLAVSHMEQGHSIGNKTGVTCIVNINSETDNYIKIKDVLISKGLTDIRFLVNGRAYKELSGNTALSDFVKLRPLFISQFIDLSSQSISTDASNAAKYVETIAKQQRDIRVLVAEDNAVNQIVIGGLLKQFNIDVHFARNGEEAVEAHCNDNYFDLIIMDCEMPVMDGFHATTTIRRWEKEQHKLPTPIIALTAHVESSYRTRCFDSGMDLYLCKPVTTEKIDEAFKTLQLS